jgi:hypothetical protein
MRATAIVACFYLLLLLVAITTTKLLLLFLFVVAYYNNYYRWCLQHCFLALSLFNWVQSSAYCLINKHIIYFDDTTFLPLEQSTTSCK